MTTTYRQGPAGALMEEYEHAAGEARANPRRHLR
jgi:hypothetical protein